MQILRSFNYRLRPDGAQRSAMTRFAGMGRFVFNKALAYQQENYRNGGKYISLYKMCAVLTSWRKSEDCSWLKDGPCHSQQQSLRALDRAFLNLFAGRASTPNFKKKSGMKSFVYPDYVKIESYNCRVYLPKIGWVKYINSRDFTGTVRSTTVFERSGEWYVTLMVLLEVERQGIDCVSAVGIDVGIRRFATMSDGKYIKPCNQYRKHEARLAKLSKKMDKKVRFSRNWLKAKRKVQKIHTKVSNARKDFLHKSSALISKTHAFICVEDLKVVNMVKSPRGTMDVPGSGIRMKSGLNKAISDQGWGEFRRQLEYKVEANGGILVAVPPKNTSRTCPSCTHVAKENRLTQSRFKCVSCGYSNHADVVGAINILERGHRLLACGDPAQSGRSEKQEPIEVTQMAVCHAERRRDLRTSAEDVKPRSMGECQ